MSKYARNTTVTVDKSKAEIEKIVRRYGADGFVSGWSGDKATVQFRCINRHIRFILTLPVHDASSGAAEARWEKACRQKWRALLLVVKAKLESVDAGIATFEEAFFADIVMPGDGRTLYEIARAPLALAYERGKPVPLLPGVVE